ncbi:MAG: hypothetical protein VX000_07310 [Myxococcota bacterium]|nr:hypothetical protein [Myxococcota bacterium]
MSHTIAAPLLTAMLMAGSRDAAAAECGEGAASQDLVQQVAAGDAAFAELDDAGFANARARAVALIPCLTDAITPGQAALFYRLQALGAFVERNDAASVAYFRSVVAVSPEYQLSDAVAPKGHPLRTHFSVAQGTVPVPEPLLPEPRDGAVHVDGRRATTAPIDRPWIYQRLGSSGDVLESALLEPGDAVPAYASMGSVGPRRRPNLPLAATAGAAAITSGVLYLSARSRASAFWDPTTPDADLASLRMQANTRSWLSAGAGLVAVGAGAGAFIAGNF